MKLKMHEFLGGERTDFGNLKLNKRNKKRGIDTQKVRRDGSGRNEGECVRGEDSVQLRGRCIKVRL